mmetsp:Transcript_7515/g.14882  ORF Transcript_7515/g.14882 Transcript_7515/m.14882 type:complete len:87 (-) Transcript_7515:4-264(-)
MLPCLFVLRGRVRHKITVHQLVWINVRSNELTKERRSTPALAKHKEKVWSLERFRSIRGGLSPRMSRPLGEKEAEEEEEEEAQKAQ